MCTIYDTIYGCGHRVNATEILRCAYSGLQYFSCPRGAIKDRTKHGLCPDCVQKKVRTQAAAKEANKRKDERKGKRDDEDEAGEKNAGRTGVWW